MPVLKECPHFRFLIDEVELTVKNFGVDIPVHPDVRKNKGAT